MKLKRVLPVLLALLLVLTACAPARTDDDADFTMPPTGPTGGQSTEPDPTDPVVPDPTDPIVPDPTDPIVPDPTDPTVPDPTDPTDPESPDPSEPTLPGGEFDPGDTDHIHRFGSWKVEQKATCVKQGRKVRYCDCGEAEIKTYIEEHKYGEWGTKEEATCTEQGLNARYCTVCNAEDTTIKAPLGHDEVVTPGTPATCTSPGVTDLIQCGRCNAILQEAAVIEAGHKIVTQKAVEPVCGLPGQTKGSYCSLCLEVFEKSEVIPAVPHDPVTVPGKAATCTDIGLTDSIVCSKCDAVLSRAGIINRLAHDMVDGVCTRCGHDCDHGVDPAKLDSSGKFEKYVETVDGTDCMNRGYAVYACEKCGQKSQYHVSYIHGVSCDTTDYRTVVDPTPYRTGMIESHCKDCGNETHYIVTLKPADADERLEFSEFGSVKFQYGEEYSQYFIVSDERPAGSSPLSFRIISATELEVLWKDENGKDCSVILTPDSGGKSPSTKCVISTGGKAYVSHFGWVAVG